MAKLMMTTLCAVFPLHIDLASNFYGLNGMDIKIIHPLGPIVYF